MKNFIFSILFFLLFTQSFTYSHEILGGDITWTCVNSGPNTGKYVFKLTLFNECAEGPWTTSSQIINVYGASINSIVTVFQSEVDISPFCYNPGQQISCDSGTFNAMSQVTYLSQPVSLSGTIPASGWIFTWNNCCRPITENIQTNAGYTLRSIMYPYPNHNPGTCYDNSPQFMEKPVSISCSGYPFTMNHKVYDADLDDLKYEFSPCLDNSASWPPAQAPWKAGYSTNSPFPGTSFNPNNQPASILDYNGEISFTNLSTYGYHTYCTGISSYRNGILIAEVFRDFTIFLDSCKPTPTVPPIANTPPAVVFKESGSPVSIPFPAIYTINAGDSLTLNITSTDIQFLPGFNPQTNYLIPSSSQFGTKYSDPAGGCLYPPCAILDTSNAYYNSIENYWEGNFGIATSLKWKTDTIHGSPNGRVFNFHFYVQDNWCPSPGINEQTFSVVVIGPGLPIGVENNQINTDVTLFPNPANELISIQFNSQQKENMQIEIFDVAGNRLMSESFLSSIGKSDKVINIESLNKGLYFVKLTSQDHSVSLKFIKQ